ncbi:hypothetical protein SCHIN_v1c04610 [Spiroplasma chinense]|uniref:Uncharacterized protein n=1 Tax=Spiroplasma chinense TaxID=216932 RepID=A0A5B9Y3E7_9MOLU|nr:hypothetical protein [Spiroplasma chinense]QEH61658.1 hypothetical protein SCHIN_v1c04610 [Spiroplasma chinense]
MEFNKIEVIVNKLENIEEKVISNFIIVELINLMNKYNNLLKVRNIKVSNTPSEEILQFLDSMFDLVDGNNFLIKNKFDSLEKKSVKETKLTYINLKNLGLGWTDLYKRYNFLITLFKNQKARFLFIEKISELIIGDLNNKSVLKKYLKEFKQIPKDIVESVNVQDTFKLL